MTTTPPDSLAAFDAAQAALAATHTTELLRKAYALTHQVHVITETAEDRTQSRERRNAARLRLADLRQARGMIDAEVLRRTGGQ